MNTGYDFIKLIIRGLLTFFRLELDNPHLKRVIIDEKLRQPHQISHNSEKKTKK